mmetsp:Transcript_68247/g.135250  ORF Transcript_68247/g.135250 Transcript_68247/m.135250 type:complete len:305 (+) Transcript_68247:187-1101(+)
MSPLLPVCAYGTVEPCIERCPRCSELRLNSTDDLSSNALAAVGSEGERGGTAQREEGDGAHRAVRRDGHILEKLWGYSSLVVSYSGAQLGGELGKSVGAEILLELCFACFHFGRVLSSEGGPRLAHDRDTRPRKQLRLNESLPTLRLHRLGHRVVRQAVDTRREGGELVCRGDASRAIEEMLDDAPNDHVGRGTLSRLELLATLLLNYAPHPLQIKVFHRLFHHLIETCGNLIDSCDLGILEPDLVIAYREDFIGRADTGTEGLLNLDERFGEGGDGRVRQVSPEQAELCPEGLVVVGWASPPH